jgi:monoamine oxidase
MNKLPTNPDIIIVGAGTAGLSAAKALIAKGFDVVVLEADAHVGGRCYTNNSVFDMPFDMGGSWLHSAEINPLARLAEQKGVELHKKDWECAWVHSDNKALTNAHVDDYNLYHKSMWQAIKDAGNGTLDVSSESVLPTSPWKDTAKHWIAQMQGADADVTSANDIRRYQETPGNWLVAGGLGAFVKSLHADVPVHLNCPVLKIDHSGEGVRAVTPNGTVAAKYLVVTVSTGVLAAETIEFVPQLPDPKMAAIQQLPNGLLNKVGIDFDPQWKEAITGQLADYKSGQTEFCTLLFGFYDTSFAVGFVAGGFADQLENEGSGAATEYCLQGLRSVFGNDVMNFVRRTHETAWRGNANALGSYSYALPGGADGRSVLAEPVDERLYFAGEATMPDAYATVHGAYQSGLEVAQKIVAAHR